MVAVLSGGNVDPLLMMRVIEHGLAAAARYLRYGALRRPARRARRAAGAHRCAGSERGRRGPHADPGACRWARSRSLWPWRPAAPSTATGWSARCRRRPRVAAGPRRDDARRSRAHRRYGAAACGPQPSKGARYHGDLDAPPLGAV